MTATTIVLAVPNRTLGDALAEASTRRGWDVVAEAADLEQLLAAVAAHHPDLVVATPELGGRPLAPSLAAVRGQAGDVVIIADESLDEPIVSHLLAGAQGWFDLDTPFPDVLAGMQRVLDGWPALTGPAAQVVLHQWRAFTRNTGGRGSIDAPGLTDRESDVLTAMARGLSTKAIASELRLAAKTVENHKTRIFTKLGASNAAHALTIAADRGLLDG